MTESEKEQPNDHQLVKVWLDGNQYKMVNVITSTTVGDLRRVLSDKLEVNREAFDMFLEICANNGDKSTRRMDEEETLQDVFEKHKAYSNKVMWLSKDVTTIVDPNTNNTTNITPEKIKEPAARCAPSRWSQVFQSFDNSIQSWQEGNENMPQNWMALFKELDIVLCAGGNAPLQQEEIRYLVAKCAALLLSLPTAPTSPSHANTSKPARPKSMEVYFDPQSVEEELRLQRKQEFENLKKLDWNPRRNSLPVSPGTEGIKTINESEEEKTKEEREKEQQQQQQKQKLNKEQQQQEDTKTMQKMSTALQNFKSKLQERFNLRSSSGDDPSKYTDSSSILMSPISLYSDLVSSPLSSPRGSEKTINNDSIPPSPNFHSYNHFNNIINNNNNNLNYPISPKATSSAPSSRPVSPVNNLNLSTTMNNNNNNNTDSSNYTHATSPRRRSGSFLSKLTRNRAFSLSGSATARERRGSSYDSVNHDTSALIRIMVCALQEKRNGEEVVVE